MRIGTFSLYPSTIAEEECEQDITTHDSLKKNTMKPPRKGKKKKVKKSSCPANDENEPPQKMFDAIALNLFGSRGGGNGQKQMGMQFKQMAEEEHEESSVVTKEDGGSHGEI